MLQKLDKLKDGKSNELEQSPALMLSNKFKEDENFSIIRKGDYTWELFTLDEPMIINHIYKLKLIEFSQSENKCAIEVGVSPTKYYKYKDGSLMLVYGYLVKNGAKFSKKYEESFASGAQEGDIIGVALSIANESNYNVEIFKNIYPTILYELVILANI